MANQGKSERARRRPGKAGPASQAAAAKEPRSELLLLARLCRETTTLDVRVRFAEEFVIRVSGAVRDFVFRRVRQEFAEDVHQEVLMAIALHIHEFQGDTEAQVWQWCYRVARNKVADCLRQHGGGTTAAVEVEEGRRALAAEAQHERILPGARQDLEYALLLLGAVKPPCVDLLWEYYILDLDYDELAAWYARSVDTVRMQIRRCLELAQTLLAKAH
jgi:RNA polymerase sigma factor (sigma-70 family)